MRFVFFLEREGVCALFKFFMVHSLHFDKIARLQAGLFVD